MMQSDVFVCLVLIYATKSRVPIGTICTVGHPVTKGKAKLKVSPARL